MLQTVFKVLNLTQQFVAFGAQHLHFTCDLTVHGVGFVAASAKAVDRLVAAGQGAFQANQFFFNAGHQFIFFGQSRLKADDAVAGGLADGLVFENGGFQRSHLAGHAEPIFSGLFTGCPGTWPATIPAQVGLADQPAEHKRQRASNQCGNDDRASRHVDRPISRLGSGVILLRQPRFFGVARQ